MRTGTACCMALLLGTLSAEAAPPATWHCVANTDGTWTCDSTITAPVLPQPSGEVPAPDAPAPATAPPATGPAGPEIDHGDAGQPAGAPAVNRIDAGQAAQHTPALPAGAAQQQTGTADERWALCGPIVDTDLLEENAETTDLIELQADSAAASPDRVFLLKGDAVIRYGFRTLRANDITYRQEAGEIEAAGGIHFTGPDLVVTGDSALLQTDADRGNIRQLTYALPQQHIRGGANLLVFDGATRQHLEKASYTTCPPGNRDWQLTAREVDLDHSDGTGVARNARVTFKGVPLLYTPYISFPLDDRRKSGLLFPRIGTTEQTGIDISQPIYWNIAPDLDATFTPRLMSDRGQMLGGEFRFLNRNNSGSINGEYLASDDKFNQQDRHFVNLSFDGNPNPRVETRIYASDVSDVRYFEDLSSDLVQTSQTSLERTASVVYHGDDWNAGMLVQDFQNLDATLASVDRPYRQLPRLTFDYHPARRLLGVAAAGLNAEVNVFTHSDGTVVKGSRLDLQPRFSLPVRTAGWYVEPAVGVRHTAYLLDNTAAGVNKSPTRTTPVVTFDAGSFFERQGSWGDKPYVQTLEPRLYYLYVTEKDQDDLPVFDTGNYDFNYQTLFRDNRFNGPDRMGDANQLALALTSRFIDPDSGRQLLRLSLGSLLYFSDRTVTLPGETVSFDNSSDLIGEMSLVLARHWNARAEVVWNPHDSQTERNNYRVQYRGSDRKLINAGYRFRDGLQEQADLSFVWPLGRSWHMIGRWYYGLDTSKTIDALAGIGYERCCWGVQLVARSYINRDGLERSAAIFLQLELKGLGKLGSSLDEVLERDILGYSSSY